MGQVAQTDTIVDFLKELWNHPDIEFGEIRTIGSGMVSQLWLQGVSPVEATKLRESSSIGKEVYFGVLPRVRREGTNASCVIRTQWLWADLDGDHHRLNAILRQVTMPSPHVIVDSGNGYHLYWKLDSFFPFEDARTAMKGISLIHGTDHCYDAARVLRLPDTLNHKTKPAKLVRVIKWDTVSRTYNLREFGDYIYEAFKQETPDIDFGKPIPEAGVLLGTPMPNWLTYLIDNGMPKGQRSEAAFKVCISLLRRGVDPAYIRQVFIDNPRGIGEKYHERGNGDRWLKLTLQAASAALTRTQ